MPPFADLIVGLASHVPTGSGSPESGALVSVAAMDLSLPLEARIAGGATLLASLPRGRLATGFDVPLGRLTAHFEVVAP